MVQTAFTTLLSRIEVALEESLARHKAAVQKGDFTTADTERDRQQNLVDIRNQLQSLQELWPEVVDELYQAALARQGRGDATGSALAKPAAPPPVRREIPPAVASGTGRPIFARYNGRIYKAVLLPGNRVNYNGDVFPSPSGAAQEITKNSVNGWRFWRYRNEKGGEPFIDDLRQQPPVKRKRVR